MLASVAFIRNDRLVCITGGNDHCITIWDVSPFEEDAKSRHPKSQNGRSISICIFDQFSS